MLRLHHSSFEEPMYPGRCNIGWPVGQWFGQWQTQRKVMPEIPVRVNMGRIPPLENIPSRLTTFFIGLGKK